MVNSTNEDKTIETKTVWTKPQIITTVIALISLFFVSWVFIDGYFISKVNVIAGRQIRLSVVLGDKGQGKAQPCIMMTMMYTNRGGRPGTIFDTKLGVKWWCNDRIVLEKEFKALRELDNFLMAERDFPQYPISPVVVLGKSNEVRRYVFLPYETIRQQDIPKNFDLEIAVYTQTTNKWFLRNRYRVENVSDVWQDLSSDSTFKTPVLDIREIK